MITRISSVIRPKGSDLIFDHPYNAEYVLRGYRVQIAPVALISASSGGSPGGRPACWAERTYQCRRAREVIGRKPAPGCRRGTARCG
jgi:hypothetical protein